MRRTRREANNNGRFVAHPGVLALGSKGASAKVFPSETLHPGQNALFLFALASAERH